MDVHTQASDLSAAALAIIGHSGDPGREKSPPRPRKDLKQRRRRSTATTEFGTVLSELGLTQLRIAKLFGITPRHIRRWKSGDRRVPTAVRLVINLLVTGTISIDQVEQAAVAVPVRTNGSAKLPAPLLVEPAPAPAEAAAANLDRTVAAAGISTNGSTSAGPEPPALHFVAPAPEQPAPVANLNLTTAERVFALAPNACRWPCGDPRRPDFHFCDSPVAERPYCERHRTMAHMARPTRLLSKTQQRAQTKGLPIWTSIVGGARRDIEQVG